MEQASYNSDQRREKPRVGTLIIEDSPLALRAMVNLLETHPGVEIVGTAANGEIGLELAGKLHPDLVIADLEMPGLNGLAITETLRRRFPAMRLVVVSVHDGVVWQKLSRTKGADSFLSKPRAHTELLALIERLFPAAPRPKLNEAI